MPAGSDSDPVGDATVEFTVENAGCASCAALVRDVLSELGRVESITVDEALDVAEVRLSGVATISVDGVNDRLASVSAGSGHAYCVAPGSWVSA